MQAVKTAKTITHERLFNHEKGEKSMASKMADKMACYTEMQAAEIIVTMAKQKVNNTMRWAKRQSESIDLQNEYALTNECAAIIAWEKCPKGTICVPCSTENSERPNMAFVFKAKKGGRRVVGFKFKPTYTMYRKLKKQAVWVDGLWHLGEGVDDAALSKLFGNGWNARYIKG